MSVKILLADDHPILLQGLRAVLTYQPKLTLAGEATTCEMALTLVEKLKPDLVVMDVHMPDGCGISTAREILRSQPSVKVVIFSSDPDHTLVDEAMKAGVGGYVLKDCGADELLHAIDVVMAGKLYLSPAVSAGIMEDHIKILRKATEPAKPSLTEREKHLLQLIAEGHRNKEMADLLNLSPNSIETYRARLMKKVDCPSTAELVRFAIREGIAAP